MKTTPLNLPNAPLKLSHNLGQYFIQCLIRKKKLVWTPEEWVRQHFIHFLDLSGASLSRISLEHIVKYNQKKFRVDLAVFNQEGYCQLVIECKAPEITLSDQVLFQWSKYQNQLNADYGILTNGVRHILLNNLKGEKLNYSSYQELQVELDKFLKNN